MALPDQVGAQRDRFAVGDATLETGLVGFEAVAGCRRVTTHQPQSLFM
jgi:hypothetical protein